MKKIYLLSLAILCACVANAAGVINIYAKKTSITSQLNLYAWTNSGELLNTWPGTKFSETVTVDGVEYWKMAVNTGSNDTWNLIFNNSNGQTVDMKGPSIDTYYEVKKGGNKGLTATTVANMNPNATGYYLYGNEINNWTLDSSYEFQKTSTDKVYTLSNVKVCGFFKVGNSDWSASFGPMDSNAALAANTPITLTNDGSSKNLYTDGTYIATFTLDMTGSSPVLSFTGSKSNSEVYLKGEVNNWSDNANWQFESHGAGVYTLEKAFQASQGQFKITANSYWYGLPADSEPATLQYGTTTLGDGKNMVLPTGTFASKMSFYVKEDGTTSISVEEGVLIEGIFLRGTINNWNAEEAYKFTEVSENVYELHDIRLQGFFKIADAQWAKHNYGSTDGANIKVGFNNYVTNSGDSKNFTLNGTYQCSLIKLDISGSSPILTIIGEATTSGIFVATDALGNNNEEWEFIDNGSGYYTLENNLQDSEFNINVNGKFYGLPTNADSILPFDEVIELVEGGKKMAIEEETAIGTFELTIADNGSVSIMACEGEYDENSAITEVNAELNAPTVYYNLQGVKVANPTNGIFIKKQGNTTLKVVL